MISVVLPVYNVEKYLEQCLTSICNQTFKNFELIIVNDGSTDNSLNIINSFRKKCSNIKYIEQKNQGLSVARNNAIHVAEGDYIIFIDSDDFISTNMLEDMYRKAIETSAEVVICNYYEFKESEPLSNFEVKINANESKIYNGQEVSIMMLNLDISGVTWNKLLNLNRLKQSNIQFEPGRYTQDWYPIFKYISQCNRVSFVNKAHYHYRIRLGATTSKKTVKRLEDYVHAVSSIKKYAENDIVLKKHLGKFNLITFIITIGIYKNTYQGSKREFYKKFENDKILDYKPSLKDAFISGKVKKRDKLVIAMWKLKLFHLTNFL